MCVWCVSVIVCAGGMRGGLEKAEGGREADIDTVSGERHATGSSCTGHGDGHTAAASHMHTRANREHRERRVDGATLNPQPSETSLYTVRQRDRLCGWVRRSESGDECRGGKMFLTQLQD